MIDPKSLRIGNTDEHRNYVIDGMLKEAIMDAAIKHKGKAKDKMLSYMRIHWDKVNGDYVISGLTTQYKLASKPKKLKTIKSHEQTCGKRDTGRN